MNNGLSFVRDLERAAGSSFFEKVKSFTPVQTELQQGIAAMKKAHQ